LPDQPGSAHALMAYLASHFVGQRRPSD
jgi:hypothetical protein